MRYLTATVLGCLLACGHAASDVVTTITGDTYKGKVIKRDGKVIVDTANGEVVLKAAQVIHIARSGPVAAQTQPEPTTQPVTTLLPIIGPDIKPPVLGAAGEAVTLANLTHPEPIVYLYMRGLAVTPPGAESVSMRKQIQLWRAHAHDRRRKAGLSWLTPKEFLRHRENYEKLLREAEDLMKNAGKGFVPPKSYTGRTSSDRRYTHRTTRNRQREREKRALAEKRIEALRKAYEKANRETAVAKMREAATTWADPLIRNFLTAIADLWAKNYMRADGFFNHCIRSAPRVAAFHQGLGYAKSKQGRHLESLGAFLKVLALRPDSSEAAAMVREAMKRVPGHQIKSETYLRARETMQHYAKPTRRTTYSTQRVEWLMPGKKTWQTSLVTLPVPTYDRLTFRQAVAVAVGKHALLVDRETVNGALELFVRVDPNTVVRAQPGRSSSYGRTVKPPVAAIISIRGYEFTPVAAAPDTKFDPDQACSAYAMALHQQMGSEVRKVDGKLRPGKDGAGATLSMQLLAGESASPVLTEDGKLVGFLAARCDVKTDNGGPHKLVPLAELANLLKRARTLRPYRSSSRIQREIVPHAVTGRTFPVYATFAETLD